MKKAGIYLAFVVFLFFAKTTSADMTTGNQSAETHTTNVVNNGSVTSHTETTVNGQTTTVDTNQPGEIDVKNVNGTVTISKTPDISITITQKQSTSSSALTKTPHKNFISNLFEGLRNFFMRIFHNL